MKVLVTPYLYATSKENPLGFPAHYPWQCAEIADGESVELREGEKVMTVDDYNDYKESLKAVYEQVIEASGEFPDATWNI